MLIGSSRFSYKLALPTVLSIFSMMGLASISWKFLDDKFDLQRSVVICRNSASLSLNLHTSSYAAQSSNYTPKTKSSSVLDGLILAGHPHSYRL